MLDIKIKYHADIDRIEKIPVGDWIDLRVGETTFCQQGKYVNISLGVSMELPEGYEAHIVPRSSTFMKYGIIMANGFGVIDNVYCGDKDIWHFPAVCIEPKDIHNGRFGTLLKRNTRICQFRIMKKQPGVSFIEVDHLDGPDRGGFGSTGE